LKIKAHPAYNDTFYHIMIHYKKKVKDIFFYFVDGEIFYNGRTI